MKKGSKISHEKHICPIQKTAEMLSDTWTILIIRDLISSEKRFCELENSLIGISTRTLTLKLNKLVKEALVKKSALNYELTKKGQKLTTIFDAMDRYGKEYL